MCLVWCVRGEELLWLLWDVGFVTGIKPQTAVWGAEKWFCRKRCANQLVHLRSKRRGWSRPGQGGVQGALWEAVLPCSGHLCIYSQVPSGGPALPPTPGQHSRPALWKRRKWSREGPGQAPLCLLVAVFACDDDLQSKIVLASLLPSKLHKSTSLSQCQHSTSQGRGLWERQFWLNLDDITNHHI